MILHLTRKEKFTKPFVDFIKENFDIGEHFFLLVGGQNKKEFFIEDDSYIKIISNKKDFLKYFIEFNKKMYKADKIIIHGLFQPYNIYYLFLNPWLLKKCYWVMWGGDFYFPEKQSWIKKQVIKKMGNFISANQQDMEYITSNYKTDGKNRFYSNFYPICISCTENVIYDDSHNKTIKILVGNSSTEENRHEEVFNILEKYKDNNIELIVPLNYGDENYRDKIIDLGNRIFGSKFKPIVDFMNFEEYKKVLQNIDIGIFNHNRQQGGSNIRLLAGYGKKLYISKENSFYDELMSNGIRVYNLENFDLKLIEKEISENNTKIAIKTYSQDSIIISWTEIFNHNTKEVK
ncbi:TDP-N-acetylfucosamine:lipid II N-acetylfucosaminyltransferase [Aliarcobacter skirrowii]|uniref:TDP-N-acetylfucosamine:lipid II N-acetylfucosaminyltransferase n=1 Tax=Aliarcobacter skirrowii TaxID=28200 RepID=UPI0029A7F64E|nr:TDP-N-acetylfucosamine:lipid II N-acetylfucosaminyltransferase [Aliarcobacter skirrowii]MDX4036775.1 TDP-N-acetylfucosamine:lipid II N-acetylfucosaminyltransferase [Aliarcobacter skirrowii]